MEGALMRVFGGKNKRGGGGRERGRRQMEILLSKRLE